MMIEACFYNLQRQAFIFPCSIVDCIEKINKYAKNISLNHLQKND